MVGAVASAKDLFSANHRQLAEGEEYEGFQNFLWVAQDVPLCAEVKAVDATECETQVGSFSVGSSWNEQGAADKTLYYGLVAEFTFNRDAYDAIQSKAYFQMGFVNEEGDQADAIQLKFNFSGSFQPSLEYSSAEVPYSAVEIPQVMKTSEEFPLTSYYYKVDPDESEKFTVVDSGATPNSSTMWKPDTSKSMKIGDDKYRLYFQRTTPSVAELAIGGIIDAGAHWFVNEQIVEIWGVEYEIAERPAADGNDDGEATDGEATDGEATEGGDNNGDDNEGGDNEGGDNEGDDNEGGEATEVEESEEEEPAYHWKIQVPHGCEIQEDFSVVCKEHCTVDEDCNPDTETCVADKCKTPKEILDWDHPGCSADAETGVLSCVEVCEPADWEGAEHDMMDHDGMDHDNMDHNTDDAADENTAADENAGDDEAEDVENADEEEPPADDDVVDDLDERMLQDEDDVALTAEDAAAEADEADDADEADETDEADNVEPVDDLDEEDCDKINSTPLGCTADDDGVLTCDASAVAAGTGLPEQCSLNDDAMVECEEGFDVSEWQCSLKEDLKVLCVEASRAAVRSVAHCDLNDDLNIVCKVPEKESEGGAVDDTNTNTNADDGATSVTTFAAALVAAVYALVF